MNKVGIVGGLGPESTVDYYQQIISKYQDRLGSKEVLPELFINSINMYKVFHLIDTNQVDGLADYLVDAVKKLELVGADFAIISANTPHIVFDQVQQQVQIPMISIVEETYKKAEAFGIDRIGLIGTKFTMENDFFKTPFISGNKEIFVPTHSEQQYIHQKIVEELENGIVNVETKGKYLEIIKRMTHEDKIQGIILGCTELPMIIKDDDLDIPQFNTTEIHVNSIVDTIFLDKN
ncbi:aspartate/glutamate racemase family protein [Oceanobacillus bengalensis]|uniref:Amino acid racemase n=1 Tax=Oceanobacillus bengalensis TaxID=1435466 RepID=A0A494Z0R4_9BACI|nr:amino acid racemase [Oceanobacillus bengalensis]RKQ15564.1 amino acid racemase [Oceanobacillus bengalensis]